MYETDLSPISPANSDLRAVRVESIGDEPSGSRGEEGGRRRPKQKKANGKESFAQAASDVGKAIGPHESGTPNRVNQEHEENTDKHEIVKNENPLINDRRHIDVKA